MGVVEMLKWPWLKVEPKPEKVKAKKLQAPPPEMMVEGDPIEIKTSVRSQAHRASTASMRSWSL